MTPVQLPEVPAPVSGTNALIGGYTVWVTPASNYYTAAQLREYATAAVLADRASIDAADILAGVQRWELGSNQFGFGIHHRQGGSFVKRADVVVAIAAYATPSETNSDP